MKPNQEILLLIRGIESLTNQIESALGLAYAMDLSDRRENLVWCLNKLLWKVYGGRNGESGKPSLWSQIVSKLRRKK